MFFDVDQDACTLKNAVGQPHMFRYEQHLSTSVNFLGKVLRACRNVLRGTVRFLAATYKSSTVTSHLPHTSFISNYC